MASQPQESVLTEEEAREAERKRKALAARYDCVLGAIRGLSPKFSIIEVVNATLLLEIQHLAQEKLRDIGHEIDKTVKSWDLLPYHRGILLKPSWTPAKTDTPDAYFSRKAGTKPRLLLRLTSKKVLSKVQQLLSTDVLVDKLISFFDGLKVHEQITNYIRRWDELAPEDRLAVVEQAPSQEKGQNKRPRG
jgi:uncharacterized membrane-anchored protein YjiN (DUF445 family)